MANYEQIMAFMAMSKPKREVKQLPKIQPRTKDSITIITITSIIASSLATTAIKDSYHSTLVKVLTDVITLASCQSPSASFTTAWILQASLVLTSFVEESFGNIDSVESITLFLEDFIFRWIKYTAFASDESSFSCQSLLPFILQENLNDL